MDNLTNSCFEFFEISTLYAETLTVAHARCFEISWSPKDFYELLNLPTVFGFIAHIVKKNSNMSDIFLRTKTNKNSWVVKGFVLCSVAQDQCEILTICVSPEWRCRGLATNLMKNVITRAKNIGVKEIFLEVAENNKIACNLYINQGFKEFGRRNRYYRQKEKRVDAIQLSKIICC